jgi:hypothetical protein
MCPLEGRLDHPERRNTPWRQVAGRSWLEVTRFPKRVQLTLSQPAIPKAKFSEATANE